MKVEILTALTQQANSPAHLMELILESQSKLDQITCIRRQREESVKAHGEVLATLRASTLGVQAQCSHRATEFHQGDSDMESYHRCLICDKALTDKPVLISAPLD